MEEYEAEVVVEVTLTYTILMRVEAGSAKEAETKMIWEALGLSRQELDLRCDHGDVTQHYDGQETAVASVGQVEVVPDEEPEAGG